MEDLPSDTWDAYVRQRMPLAQTTDDGPRDEAAWLAFWRLPRARFQEALRKHEALSHYMDLMAAGELECDAATATAEEFDIAASSLRGWRLRCKDVPRKDWLPALANQYKNTAKKADIDPELLEIFLAEATRPEGLQHTKAYSSVADIARARGIPIPSRATFKRRLYETVPRAGRIYRKDGPKALADRLPYQERDHNVGGAMRVIVLDTWRADNFRRRDEAEGPGRENPRDFHVLIACDWQTGYPLAWDWDYSENTGLFQRVLYKVLRDYGVPERAVMDNTLAAANKTVTGQETRRFRFKPTDDEPMGLLKLAGIGYQPTIPGHGQSKPVERTIREFSEWFSKHPALAGTFTGKNPMDKPHNYGTRAADLSDLIDVAGYAIEKIRNAVSNTRTVRGITLEEAFRRDLEETAIRKMAPELLRLFLMTPTLVTVDKSGVITLGRKPDTVRYGLLQDMTLFERAGEKVTVRYDPTDPNAPISVETLDGLLIHAAVPPLDIAPSFCPEAAAKHGEWRNGTVKAVKEGVEALNLPTPDDVAAMLPRRTPKAKPEAKVIKAERAKQAKAAKAAPEPNLQTPEEYVENLESFTAALLQRARRRTA